MRLAKGRRSFFILPMVYQFFLQKIITNIEYLNYLALNLIVKSLGLWYNFFAYTNQDYEVLFMNYNKLWKLLIDKGMKKKDLREATGLTTNTIAKMGKGGDVSTQALRKICEALDCRIEDIVELDEKK